MKRARGGAPARHRTDTLGLIGMVCDKEEFFNSESAAEILETYYQAVRRSVKDISVTVRKTATKILACFVETRKGGC